MHGQPDEHTHRLVKRRWGSRYNARWWTAGVWWQQHLRTQARHIASLAGQRPALGWVGSIWRDLALRQRQGRG